MGARPRFFSSRLARRDRTVYGAVAVYFLLVFLALIWPVYPRFSRIFPTVLGLPLSLAYIVLLILLSFLVLLGLYLWESRTGRVE
ncbi:MAG: hypothetical protein ACE5HP_02720 [Gemmatimonadota bacterium]